EDLDQRPEKPPRHREHEAAAAASGRVKYDRDGCSAECEPVRNSPALNVCHARDASDGERANSANRHRSSRNRCGGLPDAVNLRAPIPKGGVHQWTDRRQNQRAGDADDGGKQPVLDQILAALIGEKATTHLGHHLESSTTEVRGAEPPPPDSARFTANAPAGWSSRSSPSDRLS